MSPVRRFTALLTGVLVLQLTLLGAAAPCSSESGMGQTAAAAHLDIGHAAMDHTTAGFPSEHNRCGDHPAETGWPASGGGSCIAMVSCVAPMLLDAQPLVAGSVVYMYVASALVLEPPTRTTAPELPPPRA